MNDPLQALAPPRKTVKIVAVTITILALSAVAVWQGLELALRLTS